MRKPVKEKPQTSGGTEARGGKSVKSHEKSITDICPLPAKPDSCNITDSLKYDEYGLSVEFTDYNSQGLRPERSNIRLSIDMNFQENATNRILACISFFKWNGQEYIPCSLIGDHNDMQHIALGNISEFEITPESEQVRDVLSLIEKERLERGESI
jgi:hypothetical protein